MSIVKLFILKESNFLTALSKNDDFELKEFKTKY